MLYDPELADEKQTAIVSYHCEEAKLLHAFTQAYTKICIQSDIIRINY